MSDAVDIILPTFKRPHTVGYAIESVLRQTYKHFTLHVIGDGCDDATEQQVRRFDDERLRFYRFSKGRGFGYAHRNQVLAETNAPIIAYCNDDDLWFTDHLESAVAALQNRRLSLVAMRSCPVQVPDTLDPYFFAFDWRGPFAQRFLRNWFMGSVNCVHRRDVFAAVGYWNDQLVRFGDREFYNRVRTSEQPSAYIDHLTVLRFYALHWDRHYDLSREAPQAKYLALLEDPRWVASLRMRSGDRHRSWEIRQRQWRDFLLFGLRSGPKFLRFWYQRLTTRPQEGTPIA